MIINRAHRCTGNPSFAWIIKKNGFFLYRHRHPAPSELERSLSYYYWEEEKLFLEKKLSTIHSFGLSTIHHFGHSTFHYFGLRTIHHFGLSTVHYCGLRTIHYSGLRTIHYCGLSQISFVCYNTYSLLNIPLHNIPLVLDLMISLYFYFSVIRPHDQLYILLTIFLSQ